MEICIAHRRWKSLRLAVCVLALNRGGTVMNAVTEGRKVLLEIADLKCTLKSKMANSGSGNRRKPQSRRWCHSSPV